MFTIIVWPGFEPYWYRWKVKLDMKLYVNEMDVWVNHLLNAITLFNAYIWFSIFLLGCGSPYTGSSVSGSGDRLPPWT